MSIVVLAGGAGAARFLRGLVRAVKPHEITIIGNTGDDIEVYGVRVCPDLDIVTYALGGALDEERGFGLRGDTHHVLAELRENGVDTWFALGDRDFAACAARSSWLGAGVPLHGCAERLAARHGVPARILPMTDDDVHTVVTLQDGRALHFQEYWVRERAEPPVASVHLHGASAARPAPGVLETLADATAIIIAPSNPVVSIGTILAIPGVRDAVAAAPAQVVAISPIIGGRVVRGMADRLLPSMGVEVSARGVAGLYADLCDAFVLDTVDAASADDIAALGMHAVVAPTLMTTPAHAEALARVALDALA